MCFCYFIGRIKDIVSVWIISDSRTRLTRQYRHLVHCIYNKFIVLHIFIYYSLEYIYIFHSKAIYLYDISTRRTKYILLYPVLVLFMYLLFLVNIIISICYSIIGFPFYAIIIYNTCPYLLFYHWVSFLCNNLISYFILQLKT